MIICPAHTLIALWLTSNLHDAHFKPPELLRKVAGNYVSRNSEPSISSELEINHVRILTQPRHPTLHGPSLPGKLGRTYFYLVKVGLLYSIVQVCLII